MSNGLIKNILKIRDDSNPLELVQQNKDGEFKFTDENQTSSWVPKSCKSTITKADLRQGIEPWLTSLFQSEHLSLLAGAGLSTAIEVMATGSAKSAMSKPTLDTIYIDEIEESAQVIASRNKRGDPNIEDYIRIINELLRGLEILGHNASVNKEEGTEYEKINEY